MMTNDYNVWAILVATVVAVGIGMVWYAPPVFGRRWQRHMGVTQPGLQAFGLWVVCYAVLALALVYIFNRMGVSGAAAGLRWGTTFGAAVVAASVAPNYAFARKPLDLFLVEMGYVFIAISAMGVILAGWR